MFKPNQQVIWFDGFDSWEAVATIIRENGEVVIKLASGGTYIAHPDDLTPVLDGSQLPKFLEVDMD